MSTKDDVVRQLFEDICYLAFHHEVDTWKDAPGTDDEKRRQILNHARQGLALMRGRISPSDVGSQLAERIAIRDLAASGGIVDAP